MTITAIDLFCGAGGLTVGLLRAGFNVLGALDSSESAVKNYQLNFAHPVVRDDIHGLSVEEFWTKVNLKPCRVDLLAGGPPCQGFSIQRIGEDEDARNDLIFDFARFILEMRPRMFLVENVPGILGARGRHIAKRFQSMVREGGYDVSVNLVNAAEFGVPQIRKRVFFTGWETGSITPFSFPSPDHTVDTFRTVNDVIGDLPSPPENYQPAVHDPLHRRMRMSDKNMSRLRYIPPGGGFEHLPTDLRVDCHKNGAARIGHRYVYGRLSPDRPAGTITARFDSFTRGKFAHPYEDRNITLREGARLQTFDDTHQFEGSQETIAALIGNAIPPLLATKICLAMTSHLSNDNTQAHRISLSTETALGQDQLDLFNVASVG